MVEEFQINPAESFIKNIVRIAMFKKIPRERIVEITGISDEMIIPYRLETKPMVAFEVLTNDKCEALIDAIAPEKREELRLLKGYVEISANAKFFDLTLAHPILKNFTFGSAYRFMREQKSVNGKYLRREDCKIENFNASGVSQFELGEKIVSASNGYSFIGKLGYQENDAGLEKFCADLADLFSAYETRRIKFGKALHTHLFPDGIKYSKRDVTITQTMVYESINTTFTRIKNVYLTKDILTAEEAETVVKLFGFADEQSFYMSAEAMYENAQIDLPALNISREMARLGAWVKTVREELSLTQTDLQWTVVKGGDTNPEKGNRFISTLELGKRATALLPEEQQQLINALGCGSLESLAKLAGQIQMLNNFRAKHFRKSIETLASSDNQAAKDVFIHMKFTHQSSNRAWVFRDALTKIGMSERELYEMAKAPLDTETTICCEVIARYVETQHLSYDQARFVGRSASKAR